jgi:hypothetical protein
MPELLEVKTIGEVERTVHASGLWDGTGPVEFSDDGETWRETWAPAVERGDEQNVRLVQHPEFARVTVYRKEVRVPTTVTIRWDEQFPAASDEWAGKWERSPMRHFGRTARMVAFRQTFRDLLGDMVIEDEERASAPAAPTEPPVRDWAAEIAATENLDALSALDAEARVARVFTPDAAGTALHRQMRARRMQLADAAWSPAAEPALAPASMERPQPQDRLPGNRAERRAATRKKGRRR